MMYWKIQSGYEKILPPIGGSVHHAQNMNKELLFWKKLNFRGTFETC